MKEKHKNISGCYEVNAVASEDKVTAIAIWKTVRKVMMGRVRVSMQAKTVDGKMLYHRIRTKAEGDQIKIYRTLGLSSSILRSKKTVI